MKVWEAVMIIVSFSATTSCLTDFPDTSRVVSITSPGLPGGIFRKLFVND